MSTRRGIKALTRRLDLWDLRVYRRSDGPGMFDPVTLEASPAASSVIFDGRGAFGARRSGQRRDDAFADRREEVGMLRIDRGEAAGELIRVDDEIEFLSGPLAGGPRWFVIGAMESAFGLTRRFMVSTVRQEVSQS